MKISFLVPDISSAILGATTTLARLLEDEYEVEIVGPDLGHGVSPLYRNSFPYKIIPAPRMYRWPDFLWESRPVVKALSGDVIVAMKAFAGTLPLALRKRHRDGGRVVVYLDEWDGSLMCMRSPGARFRNVLCHWQHPLDDLYCPLVEKLIPRCDDVWSTTSFLQERFGGQLIQGGVDCGDFSPRPRETMTGLRDELGLVKKKILLFGGVVRPHKGVDFVLEAISRIQRPDVVLLVVGPETDHLKSLMNNPAYAAYVRCTGTIPKEHMPDYLGIADVIIVPLADNLLSRSQMPCKVFEAMAMEKPIIASAVSDLPRVLEGCGWLVPPGNVSALAETICHVLDNPAEAQGMGCAARQQCLAEYSRERTREKLVGIIDGQIAGGEQITARESQ